MYFDFRPRLNSPARGGSQLACLYAEGTIAYRGDEQGKKVVAALYFALAKIEQVQGDHACVGGEERFDLWARRSAPLVRDHDHRLARLTTRELHSGNSPRAHL